jgi:molybdopterin-biosynthesis enzyme MoeA-like protein
MQFATGDGRAAGHIGAVLVLDAAPGFSVPEGRRVLDERIRAVPRLRQRLYRAPPGCGRPYWADDPAFDIDKHVRQVRCPPPGDERALLDLAAAQLREPMPRSRPLWSATFVSGLAGGGTGLLVIMDHVLADGIAGLAVLSTLVDQVAGTAQARPDRFPVPAPRARELASDAWRGRLRRSPRAEPGTPRQARGLRRIREGIAELGGARPPRHRVGCVLRRVLTSFSRQAVQVARRSAGRRSFLPPGLEEAAIVDALNALRSRYTYVFTTGGIGPTHDDITADCVAKAFGVSIDVDPRALAIMQERLVATGTEMNEARLRMTRIPKGADLVVNKVSGAPGIWLGNVIVMAGVPSIMQAMLDEVAPKLKTGIRMLSQTVRADAREGDIGTQLGEIAKANPDVAIGSYPFFDPQHGPNTNVVLRARDPQKLATATRAVEDMLQRVRGAQSSGG